MAPDTTPPGGATRYIQTNRGLLSYSQLAPLLAEQVLRVERDIATGAFAQRSSFPDLILDFHREIAGELCPDWAGQWRNAEVRVGEHHPPPPYRVPMLILDYGEDLRVRLANASGRMDDLLLETLAFAEGLAALDSPIHRLQRSCHTIVPPRTSASLGTPARRPRANGRSGRNSLSCRLARRRRTRLASADAHLAAALRGVQPVNGVSCVSP